MLEKPKVVIDNEVFRKIMYWVNKSEYEVSGLGTLVLEENHTFRVKSAMLLPQKNGTAHTDIEPEDVGRLMYALRAEAGELRFWWHSHVDMGVFWSGTDMDTIKKLGQGGWFLSSVFNKKKEIRSAYYAIEGSVSPWGKQPVFVDELDTKVTPFVEPLHEAWDEEYKQNVTIKTHVDIDYSSYGPYGHWNEETGWRYQSGFYGQPTIANPTNIESGRKRPPGVSKREWKKMRREARLSNAIVSPDETDAYGFTQEERAALAQLGWDEYDLDHAHDMDITPREIMGLAAQDMNLDDVLEMERNGWTIKDIIAAYAKIEEPMLIDDDIPVADRGKVGAL